jgi:para-aminobenzoate synthetase/4-amino-4-deoxychorismate lyase
VGYAQLDEHLARLRDSATYLGFAHDEAEVREVLEKAATIVPDRAAKVRLVLDRRGRITTSAVPAGRWPDPVRLAIDEEHPVDPADVLLFHKTTLRSRYEEAHARHPDADEVVLVNVRGHVTETTVANLAVLVDGTWRTPPLDDGLLPGTERAALLAEGALRERTITIEEFRASDAIEVLNSVRGRQRAVLRG